MSEIEEARDVLAKWREGAKAPGRWHLGPQDPDGFVDIDTQDGTIVSSWEEEPDNYAVHKGIGTLIVGIAGNPALLDAIDGLLGHALFLAPFEGVDVDGLTQHAERIAAAILAADGRM